MLICAENLLAAQRRFSAILELIGKIEKGNKVQVDESITYANIHSSFMDALNALFILGQSERVSEEATSAYRELLREMNRYRKMRKDSGRSLTNYEDVLRDSLFSIEEICKNENLPRVSVHNLNTDYLQWQYGNYVTDKSLIKDVFSYIRCDREFNFVDVNAVWVNNLLTLKEVFPEVKLYAVSHSDYISLDKNERKEFARAICGGIRGANISHDCFDAALVAGPISMVTPYDRNAQFVSEEKRHLDRAYSCLRCGGVLAYVTPKHLISREVATFIAKSFDDIHVVPVIGSSPDAVVITGKKRAMIDRTLDMDMFIRLRELPVFDTFSEEPDDFTYTLPDDFVEVKVFRGAKLDDSEMDALFEESNAPQEFWKKQEVDKIQDHKAHPLLPFNVGQLGLVLTSGCLDGVVEEPDGCSHVVKGRVVKVTDKKIELSDTEDRLEVTEITSNRVEISMFLPDGTYRCLA